MNPDDKQADSDSVPLPNELTPEEARKKREYFLALYRQQECDAREGNADEPESPDSMLTTFVLPGD